MRARIYQKPRNAMQSGQAGTDHWVLEYETDRRAGPDPLMGWIGGGSTLSQLHLTFATRDEAVAYADEERPQLRHRTAARSSVTESPRSTPTISVMAGSRTGPTNRRPALRP